MENMDNIENVDNALFLCDPTLRPNLSEKAKKIFSKAAYVYAKRATSPNPESKDERSIRAEWVTNLIYLYQKKRTTLSLCDEIHLTREQINDMLNTLIRQKVDPYNYTKILEESPLPHFKATIPPSTIFDDSEGFKVIFDVGSEKVPHKPMHPVKNLDIYFDSPIEAYVFENSFDEKPYHIFRICRMIALDKKKKMVFSRIYTDHDDTSNYFKNSPSTDILDELNSEALLFGPILLAIYLAFQQALRMRPEEYHDLTRLEVRKDGSLSETSDSKKDHGPNNVRIVSNIYPENDNPPSATRVFRCECWGVSGHERRLKNGKTIFIKPYRKGRKRDDPTSYTPKNYLMADS